MEVLLHASRLTTIFLIVFVDLLGFGLILPLLPYYATSFGASATMVGLLVSSYAASQFIGAPFLGRLSDRHGRRPVLLLSIAGTCAGFVALGLAQSLWMLFAARVLDGLTGGNISVAQAYIADVTDDQSRARGLGLIGAAFGLGFIIGPAAGGALSHWGYAVPAFTAAGVSFLNLIAVALFLPESLTSAKRARLTRRAGTLLNFANLYRALQRPQVGPLLVIRFCFNLAFAVFQTIFSLYMLVRFQASAQTTGYCLAYVGVLAVVIQGLAIGRLAARLREPPLLATAVALLSVALLAWAFVPSLWLLLVVLAPMALAAGIHNTIGSTLLSKAVLPEEVGGTLGLGASVDSLTRVFAPTLGGILLQRHGTAAPGLFGAVVLAGLFPYVWHKLLRPAPSPRP